MKKTQWILVLAASMSFAGACYYIQKILHYEKSLRIFGALKLLDLDLKKQMHRLIYEQQMEACWYFGIMILIALAICSAQEPTSEHDRLMPRQSPLHFI